VHIVSRSKNNPDSSRRAFLASAAVAASAALVGLKSRSAEAAGSLPHLSESDPLAKSLGYQADAKKVDKSKFPTYQAGQRCGVCRFFQGSPGQKSGFAGCQIFAGYSVDAQGWCASFNARS
jgi:hypothetical protein